MTAKGRDGNGYTAEEVIEAIKGSRGIITAVSKRLNCSRTYAHKLIAKFATAKQALYDERESMKDFTEAKLFQLIDAGNPTMIIFYSKTQMKDRGYVERVEQTGPDGAPIQSQNTIIYLPNNGRD